MDISHALDVSITPFNVYPMCALCLDDVCLYADMMCRWYVCNVYLMCFSDVYVDFMSLGHSMLPQSAAAEMAESGSVLKMLPSLGYSAP